MNLYQREAARSQCAAPLLPGDGDPEKEQTLDHPYN